MNEQAVRGELHKWIDSLSADQLLRLWRHRCNELMRQELLRAGPVEVPDGDWIKIDQAAQKLGLSVGHLRRVCMRRLGLAGQAKKVRGEAGVKAHWYILRSLIPALESEENRASALE